MYHKLLIYDVKRTTKIDGMGPFNIDTMLFEKKRNYIVCLVTMDFVLIE